MESDTEWGFSTRWTTSYDSGKELALEKGDFDITESFLKLTKNGLVDACALIEYKSPLEKMMDPKKGKKKGRVTEDGTLAHLLIFLYYNILICYIHQIFYP